MTLGEFWRQLGPLYYAYVSLLSTNINTLAGINGSEVSQAVIVASPCCTLADRPENSLTPLGNKTDQQRTRDPWRHMARKSVAYGEASV